MFSIAQILRSPDGVCISEVLIGIEVIYFIKVCRQLSCDFLTRSNKLPRRLDRSIKHVLSSLDNVCNHNEIALQLKLGSLDEPSKRGSLSVEIFNVRDLNVTNEFELVLGFFLTLNGTYVNQHRINTSSECVYNDRITRTIKRRIVGPISQVQHAIVVGLILEVFQVVDDIGSLARFLVEIDGRTNLTIKVYNATFALSCPGHSRDRLSSSGVSLE